MTTDRRRWRGAQAAALGVGAAALLWSTIRGRGKLQKPEELVSSACVLTAALLAWRRDTLQGDSGTTRRLAQGMACGLMGDLIMGRALPLPDSLYVPAGMVAFGAGHIAYLAALRNLAVRHDLRRRSHSIGALAFSTIVAVSAWQRWVRNDQRALLSYAALGYGLLLATMAGMGLGLALEKRSLAPLAAGGALFVVSDLVLGARLLRNLDFPGRDNAIWLSYILGQTLIVWTASREAE